MKDYSQNPQTDGQEALTVQIAGKLTSQTTPEDFRRFARLVLWNRASADAPSPLAYSTGLASASAAATISAAPDGRQACPGPGVEAARESSPMTFRAYQRKAAETAGAGANSRERRIMIAALGLNGEAGEVADMIEKKFGHGHTVSDDELIDEIGDVLWYLAELATALDLDLVTIAHRNYDELKARYPDGFSQACP